MKNIYKILPYKLHNWIILHFGKPKKGYNKLWGEFKYYELHGWIVCPNKIIVNSNMWEIYNRWTYEITEAIERYCK